MSNKEKENNKETVAEEQTQQENNQDTQKEVDKNTVDESKEEKEPKDELTELKESLEEEKDKFIRLFAEFDNFRRRTARESIEVRKAANEEVMSALLPVLDDFDRALMELKKSDDDSMFKGVELIHSKMKTILTSKGLKEMEVKQGDAFDSEYHEAITQIPAPNKKLVGKIVDVVEKGYTLGDKVIRYPKVVTGQ
ncbi:MAG TPA: nucleotide exchange factor GrpE [Flavobacteriaceae bacterium]|nr:nucleotide exchange factor GrpE [Flavobacteriaceae bacterium]